jgi:hypothetical protein
LNIRLFLKQAGLEVDRGDVEIVGYNPLMLWNTHFVREVDDSGHVAQLYKSAKADSPRQHGERRFRTHV